MWAWISSFLPFCLICYYICAELIPYLTLEIRHFCHKNHRIPHNIHTTFCQNLNVCAPKANFGGNYAHFYQFNAALNHIILKIGNYFENGPLFWKWVIILKICHHFENGSKFWKWVKILKSGQNFENRAKFFENVSTFWKWVKNLKMGQHFEKG